MNIIEIVYTPIIIFPAILYPFFSDKLLPNFDPSTPAIPERNKHKLTIKIL